MFGLIYSMVQIIFWFVFMACTCAIFEHRPKLQSQQKNLKKTPGTWGKNMFLIDWDR